MWSSEYQTKYFKDLCYKGKKTIGNERQNSSKIPFPITYEQES
jgi:hypothetical protein